MATTQPPDPLDPRNELSEFLRSRRARPHPSDVGLPEYGRRRRVPGLRREELAQLAGVSVAYYTRLEQGNGCEEEHAHLLHLAKPAQHKRSAPAQPQQQQVRGALGEPLAAMDGVPAYIWGRRTDVLAWNRLASALFGDWGARTQQERNWGRYTFLDPAAPPLPRLGRQSRRRGRPVAARRRPAPGRPGARCADR